MSDEARTLVALSELRGCYYRSGWLRKERLFVAFYGDGKRYIVYPIYASRGGSPVYVDVASI